MNVKYYHNKKKTGIKIGDRVKAIRNFEAFPTQGCRGKVLEVRKSGIFSKSDIGVEFDPPFNKGHSLYKKCKWGRGLWCPAEILDYDSVTNWD